jgi:two-component system, LytTR family, response regulator
MNPPSLLWHKQPTFRIDAIVRLEANRNYTWIHFEDSTKVLMSHTMGFYQAILPEYFVQVHRSHCINISHLQTLSCRINSCLLLKDGVAIPIARRRWKTIRKNYSKPYLNKSSQ